MNVGLFVMVPAFEEGSGPMLWGLTVLLLVVSWFLVRRWPAPLIVGLFLMAVHLLIMCLLTFWTWNPDGRHEEFPIAAMHPGYLAIHVLDDNPDRYLEREIPWAVGYPLYWIGLIASIVWMRWWLIRNFDRLAGRGAQLPRLPGQVLPEQAPVTS
jgi:hypothetical protein